MPRNVRNFWFNARIDGRATAVSGGPKGKRDGFEMTVYMRGDGQVGEVLQLRGQANEDGVLVFRVWGADGRELLYAESTR